MAVMIEQRPFRPFKSSEEYVWAMKEDLADWMNKLYPNLYISADKFCERLDNGVVLCQHAEKVREYAQKYLHLKESKGISAFGEASNILVHPPVKCFTTAKRETFQARDNVCNFITWCRRALKVLEGLLFESDDLILLKNEKNFILCLLEVARRGSRVGMPVPTLVMMEKEIDEELAKEEGGDVVPDDDVIGNETGVMTKDGSEVVPDVSEVTPEEVPKVIPDTRQIVMNDLLSLDDIVRQEIESCKCPTQFSMVRVSVGKYRIGDTKVLIFVRLLRNHVMVRVGGGWDTLAHYLDKHDPCRCKTGHRQATAAKLYGARNATPGRPNIEISKARVKYERES